MIAPVRWHPPPARCPSVPAASPRSCPLLQVCHRQRDRPREGARRTRAGRTFTPLHFGSNTHCATSAQSPMHSRHWVWRPPGGGRGMAYRGRRRCLRSGAPRTRPDQERRAEAPSALFSSDHRPPDEGRIPPSGSPGHDVGIPGAPPLERTRPLLRRVEL